MTKALKVAMGMTMLTGGLMAQGVAASAAITTKPVVYTAKSTQTPDSIAAQVDRHSAVQAAQARVDVADQTYTNAKQALTAAKSAAQAAQDELVAADGVLAKNQQIQDAMAALHDTAVARQTKAKQAVNTATANQATAQTAVTTAQATVDQLTANVKTAQMAVDKDNSAANQAALDAAKGKLTTAQTALTAAQAKLTKATTALTAAKEERANADIEVSGTAVDYRVAKKEHDTVKPRAAVEKAEATVKAARNHVDSAKAEVRAAEKERTAAQSDLTALLNEAKQPARPDDGKGGQTPANPTGHHNNHTDGPVGGVPQPTVTHSTDQPQVKGTANPHVKSALRTTTSPVVTKPVATHPIATHPTSTAKTTTKTATLPQTDERTNQVVTVLGFVLLTAMSLFGFKRQSNKRHTTD
ncbi:LPXTG cell wall anchor domain-containing protein [Lactiplantibacillus pentosus]|uniref:Cell surface protein n=1 Tax=Lactiplantibacillus pentosus IG1 TaxID=1042160 RepID=G0M5Z3_LACPE|nr:LPXTG cell wall anchor domain-containing protein [Lactiplantibacillus pentosus]CCC17703.1 cell surface protein [Lactiplantibacillus pentosus IG1]